MDAPFIDIGVPKELAYYNEIEVHGVRVFINKKLTETITYEVTLAKLLGFKKLFLKFK